jgi:hypothetical protein
MKSISTLAFCLAVITLFFGTSAHAGPWQFNIKVQSIVVEGEASGARIYVVFSGVTNTEGCPNSWPANRIYGDTEKGRYLLSLAQIAKTSDKLIRVAQNGCDDWGRPVIYGIWLD